MEAFEAKSIPKWSLYRYMNKRFSQKSQHIASYHLPIELWLHVMSFMTNIDVKTLSLTCKHFRLISLHPLFREVSVDGGFRPENPWRQLSIPRQLARNVHELHYSCDPRESFKLKHLPLLVYFQWRQRRLLQTMFNLHTFYLHDISISSMAFYSILSHPTLRALVLNGSRCFVGPFTDYKIQTKVTNLTLIGNSSLPDVTWTFLAPQLTTLKYDVSTECSKEILLHRFPKLTDLELIHHSDNLQVLNGFDNLVQESRLLTRLTYRAHHNPQPTVFDHHQIKTLAINVIQIESFQELSTIESLHLVNVSRPTNTFCDSLSDSRYWRNLNELILDLITPLSSFSHSIYDLLNRITRLELRTTKILHNTPETEDTPTTASVKSLLRFLLDTKTRSKSLLCLCLRHSGTLRLPPDAIRQKLSSSVFERHHPRLQEVRLVCSLGPSSAERGRLEYFAQYAVFRLDNQFKWEYYQSG